MMEMDGKNFKAMTLLAVLVIWVVLLSECAQESEKNSEAVSSQEKKVETGKIDTGLVCLAGTEKTVVGRKYVRTGVETHAIRGRSMVLCCWEIGEGRNKKKICDDDVSTPVGYAWGILWETDKDTGQFYKSMERYQKDGKNCQQTFGVEGDPGPEHCD